MRKASKIWKSTSHNRSIEHGDMVDCWSHKTWRDRYTVSAQINFPSEMDCVIAISNEIDNRDLKYFKHDIREEIIFDTSTEKVGRYFKEKESTFWCNHTVFYEDRLDEVDLNIWEEVYPD